jgi:hypothetical protein
VRGIFLVPEKINEKNVKVRGNKTKIIKNLNIVTEKVVADFCEI